MKYFKRASEYYNRQDYKRAIAIYNRAVKNRDNELASVHNIALCHVKLKQYNKAIPLLKITTAKNPTGNYFFNLAYTYMMVKNYKKALVYFNTAWSLSPENSNCATMINYILSIYRKSKSVDKFV
ncbi:tetratricopeptide repeat protein [Clostridium sp. WILCCON 0269]|uniref:Tetratricopeptide repeat protein n=1 Tax=Candidatus Clostridium eludens TaxID=3381663 RepID=A0ABW8SPN4_9CLOT